MRYLLVALVLASASACAKKPAPKSPANAAPVERAEEKETGPKDEKATDSGDKADTDMKSDPCDGSE